MTCIDELNTSKEFMNFIDAALDGLNLGYEQKAKVSGALLHLSLEHFGGVVQLFSVKLYASGSALLRAQYESLIRGLFYYHSATHGELESYLDGDQPPKIKPMIARIEEAPGFREGTLGNVHARIWSLMNEFTHGGSIQVYHRYTGHELISNFPPEQLIQFLKSARTMALFAASHVAAVSGAVEISRALLNEFQSNNAWAYRGQKAQTRLCINRG